MLGLWRLCQYLARLFQGLGQFLERRIVLLDIGAESGHCNVSAGACRLALNCCSQLFFGLVGAVSYSQVGGIHYSQCGRMGVGFEAFQESGIDIDFRILGRGPSQQHQPRPPILDIISIECDSTAEVSKSSIPVPGVAGVFSDAAPGYTAPVVGYVVLGIDLDQCAGGVDKLRPVDIGASLPLQAIGKLPIYFVESLVWLEICAVQRSSLAHGAETMLHVVTPLGLSEFFVILEPLEVYSAQIVVVFGLGYLGFGVRSGGGSCGSSQFPCGQFVVFPGLGVLGLGVLAAGGVCSFTQFPPFLEFFQSGFCMRNGILGNQDITVLVKCRPDRQQDQYRHRRKSGNEFLIELPLAFCHHIFRSMSR